MFQLKSTSLTLYEYYSDWGRTNIPGKRKKPDSGISISPVVNGATRTQCKSCFQTFLASVTWDFVCVWCFVCDTNKLGFSKKKSRNERTHTKETQTMKRLELFLAWKWLSVCFFSLLPEEVSLFFLHFSTGITCLQKPLARGDEWYLQDFETSSLSSFPTSWTEKQVIDETSHSFPDQTANSTSGSELHPLCVCSVVLQVATSLQVLSKTQWLFESCLFFHILKLSLSFSTRDVQKLALFVCQSLSKSKLSLGLDSHFKCPVRVWMTLPGFQFHGSARLSSKGPKIFRTCLPCQKSLFQLMEPLLSTRPD